MGKIRRDGYVFITWKGDHPPLHVHVFRDGVLVLKWNLDQGVAMIGHAPRRLRKAIAELQKEGRL